MQAFYCDEIFSKNQHDTLRNMAASSNKSTKYTKISNGAQSKIPLSIKRDNATPLSSQSNGAYDTDTGSDSDGFDSSFPDRPRSESIYNDTNLTHGLVREMVERLKIGITFLLHDQSPLWTERSKHSVLLPQIDQVDSRNSMPTAI